MSVCFLNHKFNFKIFVPRCFFLNFISALFVRKSKKSRYNRQFNKTFFLL